MVFKKGMPNPNIGGLSPKERALKVRLQDLTFKAVNTLEKLMDDGSNGEKLSAAREILDRALGKAKIKADIGITHEASDHLAALVSMASNTAQRVGHVPLSAPTIEGQVIDIIEEATNLENKEHVDVRPLEDNEHTQDRKKD